MRVLIPVDEAGGLEGTTAREALERLKRGELREFPAELAHEPRRRH
jgi:predicted Fe-Mo cluster-binding NifX family protein